MEESVLDPVIPYIGPIPEGVFRPGNAIKIQGTIPASAYRFNIALQCGPDTIPRDDVALLITVRLLDGYVSVNALQNGAWGDQLRGDEFAVKRGDNFEIDFLCDSKQYRVQINGKHYCVFPQIIRYDRVTHLAVDGDISVACISYESIRGSEAIEEPDMVTDFQPMPAECELDIVKLIDGAPLSKVVATDNRREAIQEFNKGESEPLHVNDSGMQSNSAKFETIDRYYWHKWCGLFGGVIICIIIIFAIVISQAEERPEIVYLYNNTVNETYGDGSVPLANISGTHVDNIDHH